MAQQPKICVFDVETRGPLSDFVSCSVVSDAAATWHDNPESAIAALRWHAERRFTLIAHNAEYDIVNLLWKYGEDVTIEYISSAYASAYWRIDGRKRTTPIWDSMRLSAGLSLKTLGQAIGIPKLEMPRKLVDPDDIRQDWVCAIHGRPGCIQCYNMNDSEIVWGYCNMLREWCNGYGVTMRRSLPRLAMDLWKIWDVDKQQSPRSATIRDFAREGYHGARNELFIYGAVPRTYTHDIRTYYGSILRSACLPDIRFLEYKEQVNGTQLPGEGDGIIDATVHVEPQHTPPLPCLFNGRIYYGTGTFRGVWPLSELRSSLSSQVHVLKVHRSACSTRLVSPFATTAAILIELRDEFLRKGDPRSVLPKFLLNAIVGRLGLRDVSERTTYRRWRRGMGSADLAGASVESVGDSVFLSKASPIMKPSPTANVLWAAVINGIGRQRLYPHLLEAGDDLVYCDTDSVHALRPIPTGPDEAGQLRDVGVYDKGLYLAPKFYRLERYDGSGEVRAKGVPRRYADTYIATGGAAFQTTLGVVNSIQRGITPGTWIDVERNATHAPGTRTILHPGVVGHHDQRSPTAPVIFSLCGSDDTVMTND